LTSNAGVEIQISKEETTRDDPTLTK
jgi:hypothetical protein